MTTPQSIEQIEESIIKGAVDRFLGWRLPGDFSPDAGISFKKEFNEHTGHPMKYEPRGTNLFDANQAEAMIRYILQDELTTYGDAREAKGREEERERIVDLLRDYDDHQAANAVEALTPPPQTDNPERV